MAGVLSGMKIESFNLEKAKEIIIEWAKTKEFITKVYIFGSRISGYSKKTGAPVRLDSDLDIAIEFNQINENEDCFTSWVCEAKKWHKELLGLLGFIKEEHLDLEWYHPEETPHMHQFIRDNSIIIYDVAKREKGYVCHSEKFNFRRIQ